MSGKAWWWQEEGLGATPVPLGQRLVAAAGGASNVAATFLYGVNATLVSGAVSAWADANGGAATISQATASKRPTDTGSAYQCDGVNDTLSGLFTISAEPVTYFFVMEQISWVNGRYLLDGGAVNEGALFMSSASPTIAAIVSAGTASNSDLAVGAFAVVTVVFNGASSSIQVNDHTPTTGDTGAGKTKTGLSLGAAGNNSAFTSAAWKAAFLTVGTRSAGEKTAIKSLLYSACGITP